MPPSSPSVLFVSHDASRTGAPIVLLAFLRWLRAETDLRFEILLGDGGPLQSEFAALAPTTTAHLTSDFGRFERAIPPVVAKVWRKERQRLLGRRLTRPDLVYSNTMQNGALLRSVWRPGTKVLSHVHELEWWLSYRTPPLELGFTKAVTDHFVACSGVTLDNLAVTQGIPRSKMTLCHAFIAIDETELGRAQARRQLTRRRLGIPEDAYLIGGIGTMDWRKGPELFVQLAAMVAQRLPHPEVHFVWAGGEAAGPIRGAFLVDARRLGVGDRVKFVGPLDHPTELLAALDVFALTSREDPFPLVMLEAAAAGVPIVCFEGAGGSPEFVLPGAGHVAPYLDVAHMADLVVQLLGHAEERHDMGRVGAARVRDRHTVDRAGPALVDVISELLGHRPAGARSARARSAPALLEPSLQRE